MRGGWEGGCVTFDTDVAVQSSCDESTDHGEDITGRLEAVLGDTKVAGVDDILALVAVHEKAVEHVYEVDEELSEPHALCRIFN